MANPGGALRRGCGNVEKLKEGLTYSSMQPYRMWEGDVCNPRTPVFLNVSLRPCSPAVKQRSPPHTLGQYDWSVTARIADRIGLPGLRSLRLGHLLII